MNRSALARVLALALVVVAGCTSSERREPRPRVVVSSFTGTVRASDGSVRITADAPASAAGFVEIPVVQDGRPGSGPDDTVELVTESAGDVAAACGSNVGFQGVVRVRSFYRSAVLKDVYAEITGVTPSAHEGCNSATPPPGLSAQYGLFSHGTIGRAGTAGDSSAATWVFRHADAQDFTFRGRIVADLVTGDVTAPTVVASPPAGIYASAQAVTLSCSDAEAGCQAIYYTTSGADPTTASSLYTGPITVPATRTVKFLAVDHAGNASAVQTAAYTIDTVPPSVLSISPRDGKTNVPTTSTVVLTFSEPMQVTTTGAAIAVVGPEGPVAGTVTSNGAGTAFTVTPATALAVGAKYAVSVGAGARDVAGNALPPSGSWFTTPAPVVQVSGATQARYENGAVASLSNGNRLAVWGTRTLTGYRIVASLYTSATSAWSTPATLYAAGRQGPAGMTAPIVVKVATNGTGFLVAWSTGSDVKGVLVNGSGAPGTVLTLLSNVSSSKDWAVAAASGGGYAVLGAFLGTVTANVYAGTSWATSTLASAPGSLDPFVAHNGTTYVAGYRETNASLHLATYTAATKTWSATVALGASVDQVPPAIAASGNSTFVVWAERGAVKAAVSTTAPLSFSGVDAIAVAGSSASTSLSACVSYGTYATFAATWRATVGGVVNAYGVTLGQFGWSTPVALEGQGGHVLDLKLASTGSWNNPSFLAAMQIQSGGALDLYANASTGTTWGSAQLLESGSSDASRPALAWVAAGAGIVTWDQDDGTGPQIHARPIANGNLGTASAIGGAPPEGSVKGLRTASRAAGELMAVWTQDERNDTAVYAAIRTATGWSAPVLVASRAVAPVVASNGTTYLVVYQQWTATSQRYDVAAVEWTGSAFDPVNVLATGVSMPSVASDGSGYATAWVSADHRSVAARIREGGTWGPVQTVVTPPSVDLPSIAGRTGEYLLVYLEMGSWWTMKALRATPSGGIWSWSSPSSIGFDGAYATVPATIAAGPSGYGVAWYYAGSSDGSTPGSTFGSAWNGSTWVSTGLGSGSMCSVANPPVTIAAVGSGYRATSNCANELSSTEFAGGAWGSRSTAYSWATGAALSTDGARYRLLATVPSASPITVFAKDWVGSTAQPSEVVDTLPYTTSYWGDLALDWDGTANIALWTRQQAGDAAAERVFSRWSP